MRSTESGRRDSRREGLGVIIKVCENINTICFHSTSGSGVCHVHPEQAEVIHPRDCLRSFIIWNMGVRWVSSSLIWSVIISGYQPDYIPTSPPFMKTLNIWSLSISVHMKFQEKKIKEPSKNRWLFASYLSKIKYPEAERLSNEQSHDNCDRRI